MNNNEEPNKNGIRNIEKSPVSGVVNNSNSSNGKKISREEFERRKRMAQRRMNRNRRGGMSIKKLIFLIGFVLIIFALLASTTLSSAVVDIKLLEESINIQSEDFNATKEPLQTGDITYSIKGPFTVEKEAVITSVRSEPQISKARGTVTIYNVNKNNDTLPLVDTTRLVSTNNGLTYRIAGMKTIPAAKVVAGEVIPGKLQQIEIEASEDGEKYNIGKAGERFYIPGLQEETSFSESYAISETEIKGGFNGIKFVANEAELKQVRNDLQSEIREILLSKLEESLKESALTKRLVFEDGIFINFELVEEIQGNKQIIVKEKGVLEAISLRESELAVLLYKRIVREFDNFFPTEISESSLDFTLLSKEEFKKDNTSIDIKINGSANLLFDIDDVLYKKDIIGLKKDEVVVKTERDYPQIFSVENIKIFPFWKRSIPSSSSKVTINRI